MGTSRPQARATDPSRSTLSSPTYPHPQPPCLTTPPHPRCSSQPRTTADGRQQLEAIPQRERTAEILTAINLCPVFAIHQIQALALGGQLQPAIRNETEAQTAHAAVVHEILSALRSALVRRVENPPGP